MTGSAGKSTRTTETPSARTLQKSSKKAPNRTPKKVTQKTPKQAWKLAFTAVLMLIWVGASVIVSQLVVGYIMIAIMGREQFTQPVPTAIFSALSYILAMVLVIFVPMAIRNRRKAACDKKLNVQSSQERTKSREAARVSLGLKGWPTWTDIGLAPVGFIVYFLLAAGISAIFTMFPWFDAEQAQDVGFSVYSTGADRVIAFFTLVVVAPIAEEIIFRGWLYGKLREKFHSQMPDKVGMVLAILLVSVLFGAVHMQWNVGVNVFAMSVVLCGLREITGTIYAGIIMHMLKNGIAFYLLYVLGIG